MDYDVELNRRTVVVTPGLYSLLGRVVTKPYWG
jgi:hypothetical protein